MLAWDNPREGRYLWSSWQVDFLKYAPNKRGYISTGLEMGSGLGTVYPCPQAHAKDVILGLGPWFGHPQTKDHISKIKIDRDGLNLEESGGSSTPLIITSPTFFLNGLLKTQPQLGTWTSESQTSTSPCPLPWVATSPGQQRVDHDWSSPSDLESFQWEPWRNFNFGYR